jgi:hypothetical protein
VTATRDRRPEVEPDPAETPWDERPILGASRGLSWSAAVSLAFGLAMVAAVFDVLRTGTLGQPYQIGYVVGSVAAVCWVRRRNLFGPMVQAPLVFAITAVGSLLIFGGSGGSGLKQLLFSVVIPLTSNFPTMAVTTGITVAIGAFRIWRQRDPAPEVRRVRADRDEEQAGRLGRRTDRGGRPAGQPDARGAERTGKRVGERTGGRGAAGRPAGGRAPLDPGHDDEGPGGEPGYGERSRRGGAAPGGRTNTPRGERAGRDREPSGGRPWDEAGGASASRGDGRGVPDQPRRGSARGQAVPDPDDGGYGSRRPRSGESSEARRDRPVRGGRDEAGRPDARSQRGREPGYPADQRREAAPPRSAGEREPRSRRDAQPRRRPDDDYR